MPEALFDLSTEYERMLNQGIRLSGETQEFFIRGRLNGLQSRLSPSFQVRKVLDFGCGIGTTMHHLALVYPDAELIGVDTSEQALQFATEHHGSDRVRFKKLEELGASGDFDLCYVNGVFHHIAPEARLGVLVGIHRALRQGGRLALFENNPWNLGTRMVMSRIAFDRDAKTLSPPHAVSLVRAAGFRGTPVLWSLFYFPRPLAALRPLEGSLSRLPFGAQYCVLATR